MIPTTHGGFPGRLSYDMHPSNLSMASQVQHMYPTQMLQTSGAEPETIHVVGQQGRRGVLPPAPGRQAPVMGKSVANVPKNADGKYECPHCIKTYLHLKHLKRHMLRRELFLYVL